jgi:hypothetical protein
MPLMPCWPVVHFLYVWKWCLCCACLQPLLEYSAHQSLLLLSLFRSLVHFVGVGHFPLPLARYAVVHDCLVGLGHWIDYHHCFKNDNDVDLPKEIL